MRTGNLPANMKKARVIQIIPCKAARPSGAPRGGGVEGQGCSLGPRSLRIHAAPVNQGQGQGTLRAQGSRGSAECWEGDTCLWSCE